MSSQKKWNVTIAGEAMAARPFSMHDEPEFLEVLKLLRESDVTYAHLEMNYGEFDEIGWPAMGDWIGSYMMGDPKVAIDLKWAGIDIVSCAHNHSMDFGATGMLSTVKELRRCGIACAGTGKELEAARSPVYLEKKKGRVALISTSSGNKATEWAGLAKDTMPGRPGINPLRVSMKYMVDHEAAEQLKAIGKKLGILNTGFAYRTEEGTFGFNSPNTSNGEFSRAMNSAFKEGDTFEIQSKCHQRDLAGNLRSIDEAMQMADLVMVAHHFNIAEGPRGDDPPKFAREFARAAIDAGADIYLGHGWHQTLGIEIYKGKPIFYGLGNFFAQSEFIRKVPYDSYETWGHDVDKLGTLTPAVHPLHPGLDRTLETWWSSAILQLEMADHQITGMKLIPIELGREVSKEAKIKRSTGSGPHTKTEGRPIIADRENAERVLERIQRLSAPYGTTIENQDGVGVLLLK